MKYLLLFIICLMVSGCGYVNVHNIDGSSQQQSKISEEQFDLHMTDGYPISVKYYVEEAFYDLKDKKLYVKIVSDKFATSRTEQYICTVHNTFTSNNNTYYLVVVNNKPRYVGSKKKEEIKSMK